MKQWILALILLGLVNTSVFAMNKSGIISSASSVKQTTQQKVTLSVPGMTCRVCPITVRKALEKVSGVSQVIVDFDKKMATVEFDSSKTTAKALMQATKKAGYPSTVKQPVK